MCGIAGHFNLAGPTSRADTGAIARYQIGLLHHRGPDATGLWTAPGVTLAHARLAVIDTRATANQPMHDTAGDTVVVFNGEIYNFEELRACLEASGHRFRTRSDTEVIAEGYRAWGDDVVLHLRGMFAFALYDRRRDRLLVARDRLGKKPLIYAEIGGHLVFASEIRGVLAFPGAERRPDLAAIHDYLTFQYVPSPHTAFAGVRKLAPAHLAVAERGRPLVVRRYWSLPPAAVGPARPDAEVARELVAQLEAATRLRMVADVPLGAFLSGGVDSSAVVATMARLSSRPVKTFTIGFDEAAYDERAYARAVAERYGTEHQELVVRPDAGAILDRLAWHYGEPFADSSAIPTWYVSEIARRHVTVILSGDGGDEAFLGYGRYLLCRAHDMAGVLPHGLRAGLQLAARCVPASLARGGRLRQLHGLAATLAEKRSRRYEPVIAYMPDALKLSLYAGDMRGHLARSALDRLDQWLDAAPSMTAGANRADIETYLPDDLNVKVDIASMAHSLEVRSPFLDHVLMEWAQTIPVAQRFAGREPKSLLKRAMEPHLPHELLYRPKMGFSVPLDRWLRGPLEARAHDLLLDRTARERGLFDPAAVRQLLDRHAAGEGRGNAIWALMMLEAWFRRWIDDVDVPTQAADRSAALPLPAA